MISCFSIGFIALLLTDPTQDPKAPVPDEASRKPWVRELREIYKEEYAKRDPGSRIALASKFLSQATQTKDPASRYVLLWEAMNLAESSGHPATALGAIDQLDKGFDLSSAKPALQATKMKLAVLKTTKKKIRSREGLKAIAETYLAVAREALARGEFESAQDAAKGAGPAARAARDSTLAKEASGLSRAIPDLKRLGKEYPKAEVTLSVEPDNPKANLTVGRYACFIENDWKRGLPCLARGSDARLKAAASRDRPF